MIYNEGNEVDIPSVDLLTMLFGRYQFQQDGMYGNDLIFHGI